MPNHKAITLAAVEKIAKEAGALLLTAYQNNIVESYKTKGQVVTAADVAIESFLQQKLTALFSCQFYGEETGRRIATEGYQWVVDPIDGTENIAGYPPIFCVAIGLLYNAHPVLGVIFDPLHNELFAAKEHEGATVNGKRLYLHKQRTLEQAKISLDFSSKPETHVQTMQQLTNILPLVQTVKVIGSPALSLAHIATGRLDCYFRANTKYPDLVAGICLVKEAGGVVLSYTGNNWQLSDTTIIAGSPQIVAALKPHLCRNAKMQQSSARP